MKIVLVAAMDRDGLIGRGDALPWRLPADLRHFKSLTMGKPILMGRRTFESIGRPLPGRHNIVVSRDPAFRAEGCTVVRSVQEALEAAAGSEEVMVIGGAQLYAQLLDRADRMYLTLVHAEVEGDAWFPEFDRGQWREVGRDDFCADQDNEYDYSFIVLDRRPTAPER